MIPQKPPYTITEKAADYLAKIIETVTRLEYGTEFKRDIILHRKNRIRTIYSSLAIEGNTLTLGQVTSVIEGKVVAGNRTEIKEVKNAYEAYGNIMSLDPYEIKDFLKAHELMTQGLVKEAGSFRSGDVGVFDGDVALHIGARPQFVPQLMDDLFNWAKQSELHPLLKSAILHYEIEIIHPFADGNGRMGRLWQTLLLAKWNEIFAWIPMESVLYENRERYYSAIKESKKVNDSGVFIEYSLSAIHEIVAEQAKHQVKHQDKHQDKHQGDLTDIQFAMLKLLRNKALSRREIFAEVGINGDTRSFKRHIAPMIEADLIKVTIPDKPKSPRQKYMLTNKGRARAGSGIL